MVPRATRVHWVRHSQSRAGCSPPGVSAARSLHWAPMPFACSRYCCPSRLALANCVQFMRFQHVTEIAQHGVLSQAVPSVWRSAVSIGDMSAEGGYNVSGSYTDGKTDCECNNAGISESR